MELGARAQVGQDAVLKEEHTNEGSAGDGHIPTYRLGNREEWSYTERWKEDFQGSLQEANSCFLPFLKLGGFTNSRIPSDTPEFL